MFRHVPDVLAVAVVEGYGELRAGRACKPWERERGGEREGVCV
jgi:hypothetical protein